MTMQHSLSSLRMKTLRKIRKEITWRHFHFHSILPISSLSLPLFHSLFCREGIIIKLLTFYRTERQIKFFPAFMAAVKMRWGEGSDVNIKKNMRVESAFEFIKIHVIERSFESFFLWMIINFFPVSAFNLSLEGTFFL